MTICVDEQDRARSVAWISEECHAPPRAISTLEAFVNELLIEAENQNLIAESTLPVAWSRHVLDSAQLIRNGPRETSQTWLDIGSGAGFPGLVCAILMPETRFTLVEQRVLRTQWLDYIVERLKLANVTVLTANVASLPANKFDVISARALAPLDKILKLSAAFSTATTAWVLPKGRSAQHELDELRGWEHMFHVEQSITDPQSGIIVGNLIGRKGEGVS